MFLLLVFGGLLLYGYNSWKKYGVDPEKPVVYPQFNVPEDMSPAELGYIHHEGYNANYLTASLVNLAVKVCCNKGNYTEISFRNLFREEI